RPGGGGDGDVRFTGRRRHLHALVRAERRAVDDERLERDEAEGRRSGRASRGGGDERGGGDGDERFHVVPRMPHLGGNRRVAGRRYRIRACNIRLERRTIGRRREPAPAC